MSFADNPMVVVQEDTVLNKFEGDRLLETVYLTNGVITRIDTFDDAGNLINGREV